MAKTGPILIFETHPIQYRAPIFQRLQQLRPDTFEVIYASDFSVRGTMDEGFGQAVSWDRPLMTGYRHRVLDNMSDGKITDFGWLRGKGVDRLVGDVQPAAVMLSALRYNYNFTAYWAAVRRRIPVWFRADTNEIAFARPAWKSALRALYYRIVYAGLAKGLYVGELNRRHLARYGVSGRRIARVPHTVPDPVGTLTPVERAALRRETLHAIGAREEIVVGFVGKLIPKKNPELILRAVDALGTRARGLRCLFVGSGELDAQLRRHAAETRTATGVESHFAGFVNQNGITGYYLATDILVLASEKAGETWGLVVNEALQAGCAAILSDEVGCAADFGTWERVRVIPAGDAQALAAAIAELRKLPRDLDWARERMRDYSIDAAATALAGLIDAARGVADSGAHA